MAMSLRDQETGSDYHLRTNSYRLVKKVKIGPADPEILGLQAIIKKKLKNNASKTYSRWTSLLSELC